MTPEELTGTIRRVVDNVAGIIEDVGEIPSGHLYAALMGTGIGLDLYQQIITVLKKIGKVEESQSHMLRWIGPKTMETKKEGL
jgi:hypothetical protein